MLQEIGSMYKQYCSKSRILKILYYNELDQVFASKKDCQVVQTTGQALSSTACFKISFKCLKSSAE